MTVRDAIQIFQISQRNLHRKRTTESYPYFLEHLEKHFAGDHVEAITPDHIYQFLEALTEHMAKSTRRLRYAPMKSDIFIEVGWLCSRKYASTSA
jgi:hypothetical protein